MIEPMRACMTPGCRNTSPGLYCEACRPKERQRTGKPLYNSKRWKQIRAEQLATYPACQWPDCHRMANQVDHLLPIEVGGDEAPGNLQSLCRPHHTLKTHRVDPLLRPGYTPAMIRNLIQTVATSATA